MLKATISADVFKDTVDALSALVTECRLHVSETEVWARAVDTANVAMIILTLKKEAFSQYEATTEEIGLDIAKLKNTYSMMGKASDIHLEHPDGANKIEVTFEGYHYSITLLDSNTIKKDPNAPGIQLPGQVTISGSELYNVIKSASIVSDKIWFIIEPEKKEFVLYAEGDSDNIRRSFSAGEVISSNWESAKSLFSIDYLKDMGKVISHAEKVTIDLGIDHPVKFSFEIAGGNGQVEYLLAPRIEAD
ncbi:MAG TPA: DNA polymerase sliding clamp [Methanospirillum sp.]|uniref:DNA polymerase sliding clamp n=1 Tax=Methanospirillum sp. TaxID=45200 RepID=UPI002C3790CD|nr:DNA polymerase sliding clamp [Methanospirillum sp.]HOJ97002.1 DNA polymerase sliding clamp [Methanospirillum sp.]HOL41307.1 DNA polymerase sliding clamp [Methanospirillum sp.]HPP77939.1 DNA polymerase sliding clamp [Methanospirillum sp.]